MMENSRLSPRSLDVQVKSIHCSKMGFLGRLGLQHIVIV
jgi:hypothetical protein